MAKITFIIMTAIGLFTLFYNTVEIQRIPTQEEREAVGCWHTGADTCACFGGKIAN